MKSNTWIITRQIEMTKHESMNWWIQKAGTFGKVMLRRRKKSVQIFALSNLSRITSYKKNWNISRLYQYLTQEHYLLSRPDESIIIKLIQVKCDYVTISGQIWGWKKIIQESRINISRQKTKKIKTYALLEEVQKSNQNIIGINKETGQECFKIIIAEEETRKNHIKTDK